MSYQTHPDSFMSVHEEGGLLRQEANNIVNHS